MHISSGSDYHDWNLELFHSLSNEQTDTVSYVYLCCIHPAHFPMIIPNLIQHPGFPFKLARKLAWRKGVTAIIMLIMPPEWGHVFWGVTSYDTTDIFSLKKWRKIPFSPNKTFNCKTLSSLGNVVGLTYQGLRYDLSWNVLCKKFFFFFSFSYLRFYL